MSLSHNKQMGLEPDRVLIAVKSLPGSRCSRVSASYVISRHLLLFRRKKKIQIYNSGCWMKWRLKYWWLWNIAVQPPLTLFLALLRLIAFSGSAKCFEPRPHPVHTQTRGAGERVRHTAVSRFVCCVCRTPTEEMHGFFQSKLGGIGLKWTAHLISGLFGNRLCFNCVMHNFWIPWRVVLTMSELSYILYKML